MNQFLKSLIAVLVFFLAAILTGCGGGAPSDKEMDQILERIEQYRLEKYGPPNGEAYRQYFGEPVSEPPPGFELVQPLTPPKEKIVPVFNADASPAMWRDEYGQALFTGSPVLFAERHADKLSDYFSKNDAALRRIDEALAGGRAYVGGIRSLDFSVPNRSQEFAKTAVLRGDWAIAQGRPDESVEWFDRALRLGIAMRIGQTLIHDLVGITCEAIALRGYENLAWSDVSTGTLRDALRRLNALEKDMTLPSTEDAVFFDAIYEMAIYEMTMMLQDAASNRRALRSSAMKSLYSLFFVAEGLDSNPALSGPDCAGDRAYFENLSRRRSRNALRLFQVTCRPAFFKRIREMLRDAPDLFRNPVFTAEEMKKMSTPAILLLTPALRGLFNFPEAPTRAALARQQYQLTRLAIAARLYRAEKGHDPASLADLMPEYLPTFPKSEFKVSSSSSSLPPGRISLEPSGFGLYPLPEDYFWTTELAGHMGRNFWRGDDWLIVTPTYDPQEALLSFRFSSRYSLYNSHERDRAPTTEQLSSIVDNYQSALERLSNLIQSVEQQRSGESVILNVGIKRSISPLVVVSPGPSGNPPSEPPILYDATNGTLSDGALTAPVGF